MCMILKLIFLYTLRYIVPHLPHRLLMKVGDLSGWLDNKGEKNGIIKRELRRMLGDGVTDKELERITLESLRMFHKDLYEIWSFPTLTAKKMSQIGMLSGQEHLDAVLEQKKGAVIGVTHFGSWKIIIPALAYAGYPTLQVAVNPLSFIDPKNGAVNNIVMEIEYRCEKSLPVKFVYINEYMREIYRHLKGNGVVIMSFDGLERRREKKFMLLQMEMGLDTTPLEFAIRNKVPFLPVFAIRGADNHHRIVIHPPLDIDYDLDRKEALQAAFVQYSGILEEQVRQWPSHYARSLYVFACRWFQEVNAVQ